jgi:hypothetical protein
MSIGALAEKIAATVGFSGRINCHPSKPGGWPRKLLDWSRILNNGLASHHTFYFLLYQIYQ